MICKKKKKNPIFNVSLSNMSNRNVIYTDLVKFPSILKNHYQKQQNSCADENEFKNLNHQLN